MNEQNQTQEQIKTVIDPELYSLASVYQGQKRMLSIAEKATKTTRKMLDQALAIYQEDLGDDLAYHPLKVLLGDGDQAADFSWILKGRKTIDREKLLERGVSPEIIEYATKESSWEEMRMEMVGSPEPVQYVTG